MRWDFTTEPPTAWKVVDGDYTPVDQRDISQCPVCKKWFVSMAVTKGAACSTGCSLKLVELMAVKNK
jgi:hypothetical protein